jgi:hypothetical protein
MERFNNLAVLVYNHRTERGNDFDQWFLREMIQSYGDRNRDAGRENIEAEVVNAAPTIVYNEFNMQLLIAHAQHRQLQAPAPEEDDIDRVQEAV